MTKHEAQRKKSTTSPDTKTQNHFVEKRERTPPPAEISCGSDNSGPARGFGYTVSWAISIQVYGIFWSKFGYKVFSFS